MIYGCQPKASNEAKPNNSSAWDSFVQAFMDSYFVTHPDFAVYQGKHEFDGKLPDWSADGIKKEVARLKAERQKAMMFDAAQLDQQRQFEREYLLNAIDKDVFWMETSNLPFTNPAFYRSGLDPNVYVSREYAPLEQRLRAYTAYAKAVPVAVQQIRGNLHTPMPRVFIDAGKLIFAGLASYFEKDVPTVFKSVNDSQLQADFQAANKEAIRSMRDADKWLDSLLPTANDNFALGASLFSQMLQQTERVDTSIDDLERIGKEDLDRNLAALKEACEKLIPGKPISACVEKVGSDKPKGGTIEAARQQLSELKSFIQEKGLVTIPGTEDAKVAESPPYQRYNFAYIDIPGPYEHGLPSIYYVAPPDPAWTKAEQEAYIPGRADLLFTSAHEVWPGHFLQFLHSNRSPSKFGQVFVGYAFAEGWGHYAEELMWEAGLGNGDPAIHVGQLLNALLRNARFLSAIGLHTKGMTVQQSEKMFREQAYQDAGTARQQAARGTFDPAYLNYTLGKLMIRKLRKDWTATRGDTKAWRDFHDKLLSFGGPSIPLVRRAMLGDGGNAL